MQNAGIPLNGILAVIFDLDGTLRVNDPPGIPTFHRLAAELGVEATGEAKREAERWVHAYWAGSDEFEEDVAAAGDQPEALWIRHVRRHLKILGVPQGELDQKAEILYQWMVQEYQPLDRVPEDVLPTLNYLRKKGFKLGLLSNRDDPLDDLVTSLGIAEAFDLMLAAGETGWWKPDPRVFRHAAARLDVAPEASVYVGDNYFADVVGAGEAGMQPVLLDPAGLFPEAACPVISSIGQLIPLLMGN